jgi:transcriptional regulator of acetoin/glycerol metabolism
MLDDGAASLRESAAVGGTTEQASENEPDAFMAALDAHAGNIVRAAKQMGISRARAYRLLLARGIDVQRYRRRALRGQA